MGIQWAAKSAVSCSTAECVPGAEWVSGSTSGRCSPQRGITLALNFRPFSDDTAVATLLFDNEHFKPGTQLSDVYSAGPAE